MPYRDAPHAGRAHAADGEVDVLICGASFAGLAVARELAGTRRARDRCSTATRSASARPRPARRPPEWLAALGLEGSHAPDVPRPGGPHPARHARAFGCRGPSPPSTTPSCARCSGSRATPSSRRRRWTAARGDTVHTDRGDLSAPLVVDALGWRRVLGAAAISRPTRRSPAGSRSIPGAPATSSRSGSTAATCPPGTAGASPRGDEVRIGVGSFDPRFHVKDTTVLLAEDLEREPVALPGQLDPAPAAPRDRGRRLLRRRLGRALPPAHRGGHPHGALLRHRLRARAARGGRGPGDRRRGARAATATSAPRTVEVPLRCCRAAAGAARAAARCWPARSGRWGRGASSTGRSGTTLRSRRPSSPRPGPPAPRRAALRAAA